MGQRSSEVTSSSEDVFEQAMGDFEDDLESLKPMSSERQRLVEKRRRAEKRLEERRLRDELGYDDLVLDDF